MTAAAAPLLRDAVEVHRRGRLAEAERLYGVILEAVPDCADAWHLLGRIALEQGRTREAAARVLQAIRLRPEIAEFHIALGDILAAEGRHSDAVLCYAEALRLNPEFPPALVALGNTYAAQKLHRQACGAFLRAIQRDPACAPAFNNLGTSLRAQGEHEEALGCFHEALRLRPADPEPAVNLAAAYLHLERAAEAERWARYALELRSGLPEALSNLSIALLHQDRAEEAETLARQALAARPDTAHLYFNLGSVLLRRKRPVEAEAACRRALDLQPRSAEAVNNLGTALQAQDRLAEAADQYAAALRLRPDYAEAWTNLGTVRQAQNLPAEALDCFAEALDRNPRFPKAHFCRSFTLLQQGRFAEGFAEYEWRWKLLADPPRGIALPRWDGRRLDGASILLFAEQGLGDTLQFVRFASFVAARGGRIILECQPKVVNLMACISGIAQIVTPDDPLPPCDCSAPLMSLPGILGITPETVPAAIPYLTAEPGLTAAMRDRLFPAPLRVGLAWSGNPQHASDRHRSLPLAALAPLASLADIAFYSLHNTAAAASEIHAAAEWLSQPLRPDEAIDSLAALIASLDLVITVDSMPAHLAGALAKPVWTLLAFAPDWRWGESGQRTPWYPTMRLFRQTHPGDWSGVVGTIAAALRGSKFSDERRYELVKAGAQADQAGGNRLRQDAEISKQDVIS